MYDLGKLRAGQRSALNTIIKRLQDGETHTAIVMATRYGKSDLQRIATVATVELGLVCCGLSLSPNRYLRDQMTKAGKWKQFCKRLSISKPPKYAAITNNVENPTVNGEIFISTTMQFFQRNVGYWKDWATTMYRRTGKPILLFVDECQTTSTQNEWGGAVTDWQCGTGCHVVLLTATANRADGVRIPGFDYDEINNQEVQIVKTRPGSTPEKIRVDIYNSERRILNLRPHSTTDFGKAWDEGVLCNIEYCRLEIDLRTIDDDVTDGVISDLESKTEIRRALSLAVRDPRVIKQGAAELVWRLGFYRSIDPTCAAIVFCGNDIDNAQSNREVNQHANQIKRALLKIDSSLNIIIATEENEGNTAITAFAGDDEENIMGIGDVLIVKQMASLGLDISRLTCGLDLSPTRALAAVIQRMMRIATPHFNGRMLTCSWIAPNDLLMQAIFKVIVTDAGGEASIDDLELVESYEKDKGEVLDKPEYIIRGMRNIGAIDNKDNEVQADEVTKIANAHLAKFPEIAGILTLPEIARRLREEQQPQDLVEVENTSAKKEEFRDIVVASANRRIKQRLAGLPYDQKIWQATATEVWREAYKSVGVRRGVELKQINDLDLLERLVAFFSGSTEHINEKR